MKKLVLLFIFALLGLTSAWAYDYDFSAVAPTGQTLYYDITSSRSPYTVSVTSLGSSPYYWSNYTEPTGSLTIPSTVTYSGRTYSVTAIGYEAFADCRALTSVTIPNSVTAIRAYAFFHCSGLTSVTIPNSVTSIENRAFSDCRALTSVTIPNSVTSIGDGAFFNCSGLTSVTIPNSVTSIGDDAFSGCSGLTSVTIPNSVTSIGNYAFEYCSSLSHVTFNARNCSDPSSSSDRPFVGCTNISSVTIGDSVQRIPAYLFYSCSNLTDVTIGNSVTSIGESAFYYCSGLTSVTIPNSVDSIGFCAFQDCSSLTSVTIGNSVSSIEDLAFYGCNSLASLVVGTGNRVYDSRDNCNAIIETATNTLIAGTKNTIIPNSVTSIGVQAFEGCSGLTSVTIPNSVTSIGVQAFYGCSGLTSVTIPNSVTSIEGYAFSGCSGLTSVTIPNSVTSIEGYAFSGCSGLTSVTIPNSVTSIGEGAFSGCSGLTSLVVETGNTVYDSRDNCNAIIETATNTLISGTKNTVIPNSVTSIGNSAFHDCSGLTSVTIPNSVTSIGNSAFSDCSGLTSVTIPNSVTAIGNYAFKGCSGLTEIISKASPAPTLGRDVFYGVPNNIPVYICGSLESYQTRWSYFNNYVEGGAIRLQDLPYSEDFDTYTSSTTAKTGVEPSWWTLSHRDVSMTEAYVPMIYYSAANAHSGSYSLILNKRGIYTMPRYKDDVRMLQLDMFVKQGERKYQLVVGVMEDLYDATTFVPVATIDNATTTSEQVSVSFVSYTGAGHYIAFRNVLAPGNSEDYSVNYIDDITLSLAEEVIIEEMETVIGSETSTTSAHSYPVNNFYNYSLSETIVDATEMADGAQTLTSLSLYYNYAYPTTQKTNCTVYLQHTTKSTFASGSEALSADAVMVYAGPMNCSQGWNTFAFENEFEYDGTSNLMIIVDDNSGRYNGRSYVFKTSPCEGSKTLSWCSDNTNIDISDISDISNTTGYADASDIGWYRCVMRLGGHRVTLPCPKISLPYFEDFDSYTTSTTAKTGVKPTCWTLAHKYVTMTNEYKPMIYYGAANAHSGNYSLLLNKRGIYAMPEYEGEVNTLQMSLYVRQSNASYQLEVGVMSDLNDESSFVPVATLNNATTSEVTQYIVDFGSYTGAGKYIAFRNTNTSASSAYGCNYLDDIALTLRTPCGIRIADLPYTEDFDSYTSSTTAKTGVEPDCWTLAHEYVTMTNEYRPMIYYGAANAHSGSYSLLLNKRGIYAMPEYEGEVNTLQMSLYVRQSNASYQLEVGVMSDLNDESSFVPVATLNNATTSEVTQYIVDFGSYTGAGKYIAFRNTNTSASSAYGCNYIDDVTLSLAPVDLCTIHIADLPYSENFDSYTESATAKTGETPDCWTLAHEYVSMTDEYRPMIYYGAASAHSGSYSLLLNKRGIYAMPKYAGEVNTLQMSLYVRQSGAVYQLEVGVMSDLDDESTFVPVSTLNNATTTEVTQYTVDFGGYTGTGKYIAFRNINGTSTNPAFSCNYIDDVTLYLAPEVVTYTITAVADDNTMGVVTGSGEYEAGTEATLTAVPYEGYRFVRWNDDDVSNPRIVTVTAAASYTAFFEESANANTAKITMVTVENHHNRIYWNAVDDAVSYKIYREDPVADQFILVGYTSATATNWTDPTANANAHSYKYKISYVNTDGIESPLSAAHKTMHLTISKGLDNHTWNLVWSPYEGREYKAYQIYRGTSEYDMACIDVVSSDGNITYTDENATSSTVYYQVAIVWGPSLSKGDDAIMSKSNIAHYASDYTIATRGNVITVKGCEHKMVRVFDMAGRLIDTKADAPSIVELRMDGTGAYLVQVGDSPAQKVVVIGR